MAPIPSTENVPELVENLITNNRIMIFSKSFCPFCKKIKEFFMNLDETIECLELDEMGDAGIKVQEYLTEKTKQRTVPNVFVNQRHIGGCDATLAAQKNGLLAELLEQAAGDSYDYDLAVIGGGSGGLAASKEAAKLGRKVVVLDFVTPTPRNVVWGLGGTCVNVGCIPKKLMHKASILGEDFHDAPYFGWDLGEKPVKHNWAKMVEEIQAYIKSLNFGYRAQLVEKGVTYVNGYAKFTDAHKLHFVDKKGKEKEITANKFIIAVGGRPNYPDIPGAHEYGITSDDLFSLPYNPGKTLLVGASYIALECAGFLAGIGCDVTVMVRSILLRGFDQQMAEFVGTHMAENRDVKFIRPCVPTKVEEIESPPGGSNVAPGLYKVTANLTTPEGEIEEVVGEYNTIIFAVGRTACTKGLGLEDIGVKYNPSNMKVIANECEQTSLEHIYAIGDVLDGKLELTPVAIQAGKLLAGRLFGKKTALTDYFNVPTTIFTPLEYGCVGLSEDAAIAKYGEEDIEVYHTHFQPLEYDLSKRDKNRSYGKLICVKSESEKIVGFHVLSPNAGEITQGYALGIKMGATKADFSSLVGIHPTCAEWFTVMDITKASGVSVDKTSC